MQAKKLLSCGFAFLLVLAFAGVSSALDVSSTRGTWVEIEHPADGQYVGIGDSVIVKVSTVSAATALTVQIMRPGTDADADPEAVGATIDRSGVNLIAENDEEITDLTLAKVDQGNANATVILFYFPVTTSGTPLGADPIQGRNDLYALVTVDGTGSTGGQISNLTVDKQILPGSTGLSTTIVGDGKRFGIDNRRPEFGTAFEKVKLYDVIAKKELEGALLPGDVEAIETSTVNSEIMQGQKVAVQLTLDTGAVIQSGGGKVSVIFVKETYLNDADPRADIMVTPGDLGPTDSILATVEFVDPYEAFLEKTLVTSKDRFPDGQRVRVFAFLVDEAGNLSGENDDDAEPAGFSGSYVFTDDKGTADTGDDITEDRVNLFMIDTTLPEVTVVYPKEDAVDSTHMSAAVEQDTSYYDVSDGTLKGFPVKLSSYLKPLTLKISENVDSIKVSHGDSTETYRTTDTDGPLAGIEDVKVEFKLPLPLWTHDDGEGGVPDKLVVQAWDVVGNDMSVENVDITYDSIKPEITNLFPSEDSAPKDDSDNPTITLQTLLPIFTTSEDLDSLFVQYVIKDASPADGGKASFGGNREELSKGRVRVAAIDDSLDDGAEYYLQILAFDKAGNVGAKITDTLTFKDEFDNPTADSFMVATVVDDQKSVIVGTPLEFKITALDSKATRAADEDVRGVTYGQKNEMSRLKVLADGQDLTTVTFEGTGVSVAAGDSLQGIATLQPEDWEAGERSISITSEKELKNVTIVVEDIDAQENASFTTTLKGFSFDTGAFSEFTVQAMEDGEPTQHVIGDFEISVTATDKFGNTSTKKADKIDSKIEKPEDDKYLTMAIQLTSDNIQVRVPQGPQDIQNGQKTFPGMASESSGEVVIRVVNVGLEGMTAGTATGTDTLTFGTEPPPPAPGAPAAPDSVLIVEDYMGPRGDGDQGGMVLVSFNNSPDHASVDVYKLFRQLMVSTGLDEDGKLMLLEEPKLAWVPWADLSPDRTIVAEIQRAVVPALDNVSTNWAVAAVGAAGSSVRTSALGKRTFTKESVQQTLELLGMAPEAVLTNDELMNQFNAPEDYVQSIIGDQKDLVFLPVNPDVSVLMGDASVPANIRTSAHGQLMSALTTTKAPVRAVDNIAPAEVTESAGMPVVVSADGNAALRTSLTWKGSVDEGIVGFIPYRGHSIPIMGVKDYKVMRGASAEELEELTTLEPGSAQFVDKNLPEVVGALVYRIDAFDGENTSPGQIVAVNLAKRLPFTNAEGEPVYLIRLPFQGGNLTVDFEDFVAFAAAFNSQRGQSNFNPQADVDNDGVIDFADFVIAAMSYGRTAVLAAGSKIAIAPQRPGVNPDTELNMELTSDRVLVGEEISVTVSLANAEQLMGFGFELTYDADKFEFVSAVPADNDLLKSQGGDTPLFKNWPEDGRVAVVNAIVDAGSVSGEGALVTFTFKVLREFADNARFEIAQGVVFDPSQLSNPVVSLGALDVQSTPSEFALHQNFPNPFNPQTNIPYDLAESGDVVLRIYNLLGQEVRTLVSERQPAGRYKVQWAGMDDRGVSVSSGIYFYQVSVAGKFQDAKRLMLLK